MFAVNIHIRTCICLERRLTNLRKVPAQDGVVTPYNVPGTDE